MSFFEYRKRHFQKGEGVEIPGGAVGITVSSFGNTNKNGVITVEYLVPTSEEPDKVL